MASFEHSFSLLLLIVIGLSEKIYTTYVGKDSLDLKCPKICKCDMFQNLRRADCNNKRLINADTGVPDFVQLLYLDANDISFIDDHVFEVIMYDSHL
jgi:hypothetical protein